MDEDRKVLSTAPIAEVLGRYAPSRSLLAGAALVLGHLGRAHAFGLDDVAQRAQQLATQPYTAPNAQLPDELARLSYDQYRDIRFNPQRALWHDRGLPFEVQFFHRGKFQTHPVTLNEVTEEGVRPIPFDPRDFNYGKNQLSPQSWGDLGYAGFRVHYSLNTDAYKDEVVVFLGASYFRALGEDQRYGLSARGLAIDTVGADGEEFPRFVEFWLPRPDAHAVSLVIYALLDSPRMTGAYRFSIQPGIETAIDVQARLFPRAPVATLGVAPLTSMFLHGENRPRPDDFRPKVHDSDGLMIETGDGTGEWIWRPLTNPKSLLVTSFAVRDLKGFGLMQRDRQFTSYEDTEARYELRPSCWITPLNDWGPGRIELVQLPTTSEANDNVVAYWVPQRPVQAQQPIDIAYRMHWQGDHQQHPGLAWTMQSRIGHGFLEPGTVPDPSEVQYVVDFDGPALRELPPDAPVAADVGTDANAVVVERNVYRNDVTGSWRLTFRLNRFQPARPAEVRATLRLANRTLTETWSTIIPAD